MSADVRQLGNSVRVLLVIDQPVLARYITLALNHAIYLTSVAHTAEETLELITTWRPHLPALIWTSRMAQFSISLAIPLQPPTASQLSP